MTSKISFKTLFRRKQFFRQEQKQFFRQEWKQFSWLMLLESVILFLCFPLLILTMYINYKQQGLPLTWVFEEMMGLQQPFAATAAMASGILCAICLFCYVHNPAKLDFYHSLPLRREQLFAARYLTGVLTFAIPYLVSWLLCLLISIVYQTVTLYTGIKSLLSAFLYLLAFLCSYSVSIAALMLTGRLLTTVCAIAVLALYLPGCYYLNMLMQSVFWPAVSFAIDSTGLLDELLQLSPWLLGFHIQNAESWKSLPWGAVAEMGILTIAGTLLALALYRKRKTEAAGGALAWRPLEPVIKLMLAVPAALLAGTIGYEALDSLPGGLFFLLLFGTLACMLLELIYRWDVREILHGWKTLGLTAAAATVIFLFFRFDLGGVNSYLPEQEEVAKMSAFSSYKFTYICPDNIFWSDQQEILDYLELEDTEPFYQIAQDGVQRLKGENNWDASDTEPEETLTVHVKYLLKNGMSIYRTYEVGEELYIQCMEEAFQKKETRETYLQVLDLLQDQVLGADIYGLDLSAGNLTFSTEVVLDAETEALLTAATEEGISVPAEYLNDLLEAYQKDLYTLSFREMWEAEGTLYLNVKNPGSYNYTLMLHYPLGESFSNTMELLKQILIE